MAHPHNEHRQHKVERSRVAKMTKGYAAGGAVQETAVAPKRAKGGAVKKTAMRMTGGAVKHRADKRARGGKVKRRDDGGRVQNMQSLADAGIPSTYTRGASDSQLNSAAQALQSLKAQSQAQGRARGGKVKHKGATVNIINSPGQHPGMPPVMPPPGLAGAMPPRPPMAPPPMPPAGAMPPMPPPGAMPPGGAMPPRPGMMPPPGMPMRARGGRIKDGPTWKDGLNAGTPVQHSDGKQDGKNIGRGKVVTFKTGGGVVSFRAGGGGVGQTPGHSGPGTSYKPTYKRTKEHLVPSVARAMGGKIEAPKGVAKATELPGGAGGGEARLAKEHRAARDYKRA
jgi:hypothetical protein